MIAAATGPVERFDRPPLMLHMAEIGAAEAITAEERRNPAVGFDTGTTIERWQ